jgi:hypothetical protein
MIKKCTCKSSYQDKKYGDGNRVHNICKGTKLLDSCRCTVCGTVKPK